MGAIGTVQVYTVHRIIRVIRCLLCSSNCACVFGQYIRKDCHVQLMGAGMYERTVSVTCVQLRIFLKTCA